jgi:hypothetical protein
MRHRRNARLTVEQCLTFDIGSLKQALKCVDVPGNLGQISWTGVSVWSDSFGDTEAVLGYEVGRIENEGLLLLVNPELPLPFPASARLSSKNIVPITTTCPRIGGRRHWFCCPIEHDGKPCGSRVKKLYLPPGEQRFGCRA